MIIKENIIIKDKEFTKQHSDKDFYIQRDGELYIEAIDIETSNYTYVETDMSIEEDEKEQEVI